MNRISMISFEFMKFHFYDFDFSTLMSFIFLISIYMLKECYWKDNTLKTNYDNMYNCRNDSEMDSDFIKVFHSFRQL